MGDASRNKAETTDMSLSYNMHHYAPWSIHTEGHIHELSWWDSRIVMKPEHL